jgi:hypothetical protein
MGIVGAQQGHAQVITQWNFENQPVTGAPPYNNSPTPSTGTGTATVLGMTNTYGTPNASVTASDIVQGVTGDTGTNGVADLGQVWRIRGQNASTGAANGWSSKAPIGTQGAQFSVSTAGVTSGPVVVSFDWYATNQGEANLEFLYTTDGTDYINAPLALDGSDAGASVLTNSSNPNIVDGSYVNGGTGGQNWFTALTATIADPAALNDPNFGFELVNAATGTADLSIKGTALNNTSGNWRFDNVTVAVPEPTTIGLLGLAAGALLSGRRRKA